MKKIISFLINLFKEKEYTAAEEQEIVQKIIKKIKES